MPDGILKTPSLLNEEDKGTKQIDQDEGTNEPNVGADLEND